MPDCENVLTVQTVAIVCFKIGLKRDNGILFCAKVTFARMLDLTAAIARKSRGLVVVQRCGDQQAYEFRRWSGDSKR